MPDEFDDQSDDQTEPNWRRELEARARRADELEAEVAQLKKDNAFTVALAGIDHPGLSYFKDSYKGDLTPEAIRQAAIDGGFGQADTHPPPQQQEQAPAAPAAPVAPDLAAHQRMAAAQTGAAPPPPYDPLEAIAKASSADEVMEIIEAHGDKYGVVSSRTIQ